MESESFSKKIRIVFCLTAIAIICLLAFLYENFGKEMIDIVSNPESFQIWLNQFGIWDEAVFVALRAMQTMVKFIPAEPVEIASGYLWGLVKGTICCLTGNLLGTLVILFLIDRFGNQVVDAFVSKKHQDMLYSIKNSNNTYFLTFMIYLIPGMPKDIFIYMAGLLKLKRLPYLMISLIARIPSVASSVICGVLAFQQEYALAVIILVISFIITIITAWLGKNWLKKKE